MATRTNVMNGSVSATMDDICRSAVFSNEGVVHYYDVKNELLKAAVNQYFAQTFEKKT